jgi:hypothetical protein
MNDLLKQRIARALDALSDERGYQVLDYIEYLESKYAAKVMRGLAAAGQAVVDEAVKAAEDATRQPPTVTPPTQPDSEDRRLSP